MKDKMIIGHIEAINLPEFGISSLPVRVDTGAQTSSLHVDNIKQVSVQGKPGVEFDIHPEMHNVDKVIRCSAPLHDVRKVKSSNGMSEQRYVIKTRAQMGGFEWDIEVTLTNRADMTYLMLLGRQALSGLFYVEVSQTFVMSSEV
ncbi:RimK/LysX family protein [Pseudoalteromonas luteoviolacea]|uniref:ATP-dependent zinc protease family protein n=1 Tax=Pseudoalteromonas luteoviolacea TaxID=43657 RepID=UPI001F2BA62F|nr:RimK/LysX family protein [Pseudoalteromonas luteoviolacea]MCF6442488.1 RimK/LysX family protein [Pseudoalteromonas luteoviolacea]